MKLIYRLILVFLILAFTVFLGLTYVAPKVLLKMSRNVSSSTAADFGLRFDEMEILSDDSLVLTGDFIYPFHRNVNEETSNHSIIVLHPIGSNTRVLYPIIKQMTTLDVNFISFDSRAHGRSEGHLYTLGINEADDISLIIDHILEIHPDHSFGIYAKGNTGNIALRALSQDTRIRYGIIESYFEDPIQQFQFMQYDDVFINSSIINDYIIKRSLEHLNIEENRLNLALHEIDQSVLILSSKNHIKTMQTLKDEICSDEKILRYFGDSHILHPYYLSDYIPCIEEFIELQMDMARQFAQEKYFYRE